MRGGLGESRMENGGPSSQRAMQVQCARAYEFFTGRVNLPAGASDIKDAVAALRAAKAAGVWVMLAKESLLLQQVVGVTLSTTLQHYVLDAPRIDETEYGF